MAVTEIKQEPVEPIEYKDPTVYEKNRLNNLIKPPESKVSMLLCVNIYLVCGVTYHRTKADCSV